MNEVTEKVESTTWTRKTKRGNIVSVLREHYLRTDLCCESSLCSICPQQNPNSSAVKLSSSSKRYLIFDSTVASAFIPLLEHSHASFNDLILLETVSDEIKEKSYKTYNRLRALTKPLSGKRCIFLANEHFKPTFVQRQINESISHRSALAILTAAKWYTEHLKGVVNIVLLCENSNIRNIISSSSLDVYRNIEILSVIDFTAKYANEITPLAIELQTAFEESTKEKTSTTSQQQQQQQAQIDSGICFPFLSNSVIEEGISKGTLLKGKLHVSLHNSNEAEVILSQTSRQSISACGCDEILVIGKEFQSRAIHDDEVIVELLPKNLWRNRSEVIEKDEQPNSSQQQQQSVFTENNNKVIPCGKVVAVTKRNNRPYVVTFPDLTEFENTNSNNGRTNLVLVVPYDRRIPKICIHTRRADDLINSRVVVEIDKWDVGQMHPDGHIVKELGEIGRVETEVAAVLIENRISCPPFTDLLIASLPQVVPQEEINKRKDFRNLRIYSIDPPGCRDIDDALSIQKIQEDGSFIVGVHIADPSFFVTEGSLLDREAKARSTTVYMPHTRFPMIPPQLSEGLCSLHEGMDRLAISTMYHFKSGSFEAIDGWFGRTVIRSIHAMSYEQAQGVLDNDPDITSKFSDSAKLKEELTWLLELSRGLKQLRIARGALELHSDEVGFEVEHENFLPSAFKPHLDLPVNSMVEEFMILANERVAERIYKSFPSSSLLRRHPKPRPSRFRDLLHCAKSSNISIDISTNLSLATSLHLASKSGKLTSAADMILRSLATRAMTEAEYFCTGSCSNTSEFYHYGLASQFYTHFTSPIRRFADIVVHRLLVKAIEGQKLSEMSCSEVQLMADHMNNRHNSSRRGQKDAMKLFQVFFFKDRDLSADAIVYGIKANALLVHIQQFSLKGNVFLWDSDGKSLVPSENEPITVPKSEIKVDVENQTISFYNGKYTLQLFSVIRVHIGVEMSRSHKPDIKLALISHVNELVNQGKINKPTVIGKKEIVSSVFEQQLKQQQQQLQLEPTQPKCNDQANENPSMYTFLLQQLSTALNSVKQQKQEGKGKSGKAEDKTIRRWCLTDSQKRQLEKEQSPSVRPSWEEEGGGNRQHQQSRIEDRYREEIGKADKQVKDAIHQRYKQQQQQKRK